MARTHSHTFNINIPDVTCFTNGWDAQPILTHEYLIYTYTNGWDAQPVIANSCNAQPVITQVLYITDLN